LYSKKIYIAKTESKIFRQFRATAKAYNDTSCRKMWNMLLDNRIILSYRKTIWLLFCLINKI